MIRTRFRRLFVALALFALAAGQAIPAFAMAHAAFAPAVAVAAATANAAAADPADCCPEYVTATHCQAVCGFVAIVAAQPPAAPAISAPVRLAAVHRLTGRHPPPEIHPPNRRLPV